MKLGELLVRAGLLTEEQLRQALAEQKRWNGRLGEIIVQMGFCSEDVIVRALSKQLGLERAVFEPLPQLPPLVLARLPYALARELNVVPLRYHDKERTLVVAMADPRDRVGIEKLREKTGLRVVPAVSGTGAIVRARAAIYGVKEEVALEDEESDVKFTDGKGHTLVRSIDQLQREYDERKASRAAESAAASQAAAEAAAAEAARQAQARAQAMLESTEEILGFTDKRGRTLIRSIDDIRREARDRENTQPRAEVNQPSRAELLATIEALQNEVQALKAIAVVLFKKGYLTHEEYLEQLNNRAG